MAGSLKSVPCENCGAPIAIRAQGISITFACGSCGSVIDSTQDGFKILSRATQQQSLLDSLAIPLGSRGVLFDVQWEAIGYVQKKDILWEFSWDEYLLFNPYHGFRFLIHSDNHFSFAQLLTKRPVEFAAGQTIAVDDNIFALFHKGVSEVQAVLGEFYWRVRLGEQCDFADFISPPEGISMEVPLNSTDVEKTFSLARYIPTEQVEAAFGVPHLPRPRKAFPIQPNPFSAVRRGILRAALTSCLAILVAQIYFAASCENTGFFPISRSFTRSEAGIEQLIGAIEIEGHPKNVRIESYSPVDNSWVEVSYELESEDGTESGWASQAIEYYHGNSGGEYWSEGSTSASSLITGLDAKRYKLFATVEADSFSRDIPSKIETRITVDVPIWSNFFLAIFAIVALPCLLILRERVFERERWAESNYSPFDSE
jgi:hypothetical protein